MKKSKILAMLMLVAVFASAFSVATVTLSPAHFVAGSADPIVVDEPTVLAPNKKSYTNGTYAQLTAQPIVLDGNVSEWTDVIPEYFGNALVYLAYDATYAYVAVVWADAVVDSDVSLWNKTDADDGFAALAGADDTVTVGFENDIGKADYWTWTASNRTSDVFAYEHNGTGDADGGTLPWLRNSFYDDADAFNGTDYPTKDNTWTTIVDNSTIAINTNITGWFTDETTPTGSQTDVDIGVNHTGTHYIVEFQRTLAAPNADDFAFDFTADDMWFYVGVANADDAFDFDIALYERSIFDDNTAAELTFDAVPADNNESLLLTGTAFDDYVDYYITVWVSGWENTWDSVDYVTINLATGTWSYLLVFNEFDMPLGDNNITITLYAPYETPIEITHLANFDDVRTPTFVGITDIEERYPTGVPGDIGNVVVTVGLQDDYDNVNYLTAQIYSRIDEGVAFTAPMLQFFPDTTTFNGNITIDPTLDFSIQHNITYWIDAYDTSLNRITSAEYTFFTEITILTPGFGIIAGVFGLAMAVLFVKKLKK